ncbi:MAG: acyl carrier protein [Deltaproteobacteria bacterium]|jgi:acyl carrier protein|nr:acyl carrier protein [Deltaproteobacteria bacterium]MBW2504356.1 acyl carrier protein [Deltaproteobacteria bacterium]
MSNNQYDTIFKQVSQLLEQYAPQPGPIRDDTALVNDLGFDSLRVMEMLHDVEDLFDITYPLNTLSEIHTVKDFVLQIQKLTGNS